MAMLESNHLPDNRPMPAIPVPDEFRGRRFLIVEGNAFRKILYQHWLKQAGIHVSWAESAEVQDTVPSDIDCILIDTQTPRIPAMAIATHFRQAGFNQRIIGLRVDAGNLEDEQAAQQAGMDDLLDASLDADALWGCLTRWLPPQDESKFASGDSRTQAETDYLGHAESLARARRIFIVCHRDDARAFRSFLAAGHYAEIARLAHGLKGSAAAIGLDALSKLALALEKKSQSQASATELLPLIDWIAQQLAQLGDRP